MWRWRTGNWLQRRNKTRKILVIYWRYDPPLNSETAWLFSQISTSWASQISKYVTTDINKNLSASSSPPFWGRVGLYWLCESYFTGCGPVKEEEGHDIQWSEFCNLSVFRSHLHVHLYGYLKKGLMSATNEISFALVSSFLVINFTWQSASTAYWNQVDRYVILVSIWKYESGF